MNLLDFSGQILDDKYRIERELGRGGMGTVYLATHLGTERSVAVKIISPQFMQRNEFVERFRREARAAGRLRHPNVVDVTDFGFADTDEGQVAYLVMECLDGCTLGEILDEEKNLPVGWTLDILEQVCSAVQEAHGQGIIHRDLKPDNIWLEPNQRGGYTVKVLDFGIAKLEEQDAMAAGGNGRVSPTAPTYADNAKATFAGAEGTVGGVLGTPLYMSPEQCRGEHLDARSDIYSLGVIAYQMLSGEPPFTGDFKDVMEAHKSAEPKRLDAKHVRRKMRRAIHNALAKE